MLYLPTQMSWHVIESKLTNSLRRTKLTNSLGKQQADSHVIRSRTLKPRQICMAADNILTIFAAYPIFELGGIHARHLMTILAWNSEFCFPSTLNVGSTSRVSGNKDHCFHWDQPQIVFINAKQCEVSSLIFQRPIFSAMIQRIKLWCNFF